MSEGHWGWIGVGGFKIDILTFVPVVGSNCFRPIRKGFMIN